MYNSDEWNINVVMQSPKSPNLNVLNFGYFYSLQMLQYTTPVKNIKELELAVFKGWNMIDPGSIHRIRYTIQITIDLSFQ